MNLILLVVVVLAVILLFKDNGQEGFASVPDAEPSQELADAACGENARFTMWRQNINHDACSNPDAAGLNDYLTNWSGEYTRGITCTKFRSGGVDYAYAGLCFSQPDPNPLTISKSAFQNGNNNLTIYDVEDALASMSSNVTVSDSGAVNMNIATFVDGMSKRWYHIGQSIFQIDGVFAYGGAVQGKTLMLNVSKVKGPDVESTDLTELKLYGSPSYRVE